MKAGEQANWPQNSNGVSISTSEIFFSRVFWQKMPGQQGFVIEQDDFLVVGFQALYSLGGKRRPQDLTSELRPPLFHAAY